MGNETINQINIKKSLVFWVMVKKVWIKQWFFWGLSRLLNISRFFKISGKIVMTFGETSIQNFYRFCRYFKSFHFLKAFYSTFRFCSVPLRSCEISCYGVFEKWNFVGSNPSEKLDVVFMLAFFYFAKSKLLWLSVPHPITPHIKIKINDTRFSNKYFTAFTSFGYTP